MTDRKTWEEKRQEEKDLLCRLGKRLGVRYVPFEDRYVLEVEGGGILKFSEMGQEGAEEWFDRLREEVNLG